MQAKKRPWTLIVGVSIIVLLIAVFAAFQMAIRSLRGQVETALGPHGEIRELRIGLTGIEMIGLRIRAPRTADRSSKQFDWPAEDQLRAERILMTPSIMDLLSAKVVLRALRIEGAYISMLRSKDGQVRVLPSLLDKLDSTATSGAATARGNPGNPTSPGASNTPENGSMPPVRIGRIELVNGAIDFFDATIRTPPHKLSFEQINANISKIKLPELTEQSEINLDGILRGVRQNGRIQINGSIELATRESGISTRLRGVDLVSLQPYLLKTTESGVKKGTLDLDLKSTIRKARLNAPGTITLSDLELTPGSGSSTVMGMPRNAAIAMMKSRDGKISVKFVLEGDINDPRFSLNDNLSTRIGTSFANALGVSVEGLARGVGQIGSGTAKGIGESLNKLLGK